jgi:hypothetical protein
LSYKHLDLAVIACIVFLVLNILMIIYCCCSLCRDEGKDEESNDDEEEKISFARFTKDVKTTNNIA